MTETLQNRVIMIIAEEYDVRPSLARHILEKSDELAKKIIEIDKRVIEIDKLPDDMNKDFIIENRPVFIGKNDYIRYKVDIEGKYNFTNDTKLNDILGLYDYKNTFVYNHKDGEDKEVSLNKCENCLLKKASIHKNTELMCLFNYIKLNPPIVVYSIEEARISRPLGLFSYSESKWVKEIVNFLWGKTFSTKRLLRAVHVIRGVDNSKIVIETNDIDKEMKIGIGLDVFYDKLKG